MKSNCMHCGVSFKYSPSQQTGKYCSLKCSSDARAVSNKKTNRELYIQGKLKHRPAIRKFLVEDFGYECVICKLSSWNEQPITLQVDHIDGNPDNNYPSNLRLLCPNCHSQTETYKGGNKKFPKTDSRNVELRRKYATLKQLKNYSLVL